MMALWHGNFLNYILTTAEATGGFPSEKLCKLLEKHSETDELDDRRLEKQFLHAMNYNMEVWRGCLQ